MSIMLDSTVSVQQQLLAKLQSKTAVIGIIGVGYVGLPLLLRYAEIGYQVIGFDVDESKIAAIKQGQSYIAHIDTKRLEACNQANKVDATTDFSRIAEVDAIILCVPTPLNKYREPDLSFVITTVEAITPHLREGQVVSLESTTYPGTTDEELAPRMASTGLSVGENVFLVYSPEREDPANPSFDTATIPKVCGGYSPACLEVGIELYKQVIGQVVPVSSTKVAEMTKLLENIHRAVNIGLANEMKLVADKMNIDIYEVIDAAATKPFGFVPYYPGPGIGGHCIPIDPFYLTWKAREYGMHTRFIELAGEINNMMPKWVVDKVTTGLNQQGKALNGAKVLVLGIAYKKNVGDMRESPSVAVMELLQECGAKVSYSDPHVPVFPKMREHHFELNSVELTPEKIAEYDVVLLATAHQLFDYPMIKQHAKLLVDTRGVYKGMNDNVIKA